MKNLINKSYSIIKEFLDNHNNPYIAFSGGKDSSVMLYLIRNIYPDIPAVFINTGQELPEIINIVKNTDNVIWGSPKHHFYYCVKKYGIPAISKRVARYLNENDTDNKKIFFEHMGKKWKFLLTTDYKISNKCCYHLKKSPLKKIMKQYKFNGSFIGLRKSEGINRKNIKKYILKNKCYPILDWTDEDIDNYIKEYNIPLASCYIKEPKQTRTGCMLCLMDISYNTMINRFEYLKIHHPKILKWAFDKLGYREFIYDLIIRKKNAKKKFNIL